MKDVKEDMKKAEDFVKKVLPELTGERRGKVIAEVCHLLFQERVMAIAIMNSEFRSALGDIFRITMKHVSIDVLEIMINHSGRGVRLMRDVMTGKKKG